MSEPQLESLPRAVVIFHPLKTDVANLRAAVQRQEHAAGWAPTTWVETTEGDAGLSAAREAAAARASVVLASGGDGTVRAVAEGLRGSETALAIVPQGTGNLLARNIGAPLNDLDEVVRAAFHGVNRPLDLGLATIVRPNGSEDQHVFLVLAGMGLDARAISATRSDLKRHVGWLAYIDAGLRTMIKDSALKIRYSVNGSPPKPLTVYTVMIGNCGLLPGGVLLIPDAKIDDGMLDVVALRPLGMFSWLHIWNKIGFENGVLRKTKTGRKIIDLVSDTRHVTYLRAKTYSMSVPGPEPVQLDGDDFGEAISVRGTVDPGALRLRVLPGWADKVNLG